MSHFPHGIKSPQLEDRHIAKAYVGKYQTAFFAVLVGLIWIACFVMSVRYNWITGMWFLSVPAGHPITLDWWGYLFMATFAIGIPAGVYYGAWRDLSPYFKDKAISLGQDASYHPSIVDMLYVLWHALEKSLTLYLAIFSFLTNLIGYVVNEHPTDMIHGLYCTIIGIAIGLFLDGFALLIGPRVFNMIEHVVMEQRRDTLLLKQFSIQVQELDNELESLQTQSPSLLSQQQSQQRSQLAAGTRGQTVTVPASQVPPAVRQGLKQQSQSQSQSLGPLHP